MIVRFHVNFQGYKIPKKKYNKHHYSLTSHTPALVLCEATFATDFQRSPEDTRKTFNNKAKWVNKAHILQKLMFFGGCIPFAKKTWHKTFLFECIPFKKSNTLLILPWHCGIWIPPNIQHLHAPVSLVRSMVMDGKPLCASIVCHWPPMAPPGL